MNTRNPLSWLGGGIARLAFSLMAVLAAASTYAATAVWNGNAANGSLSAGGNWEGGAAPAAGDTLDFSAIATATTLNADFTDGRVFETATFGSGVVTLTGSLDVNTLTNASKLAVASGATLTVENDLVAMPTEANDKVGLFLGSNEGTVNVKGLARGYSLIGGSAVYQYDTVTENTQPIRAAGIAYNGTADPAQLYFRLCSKGGQPGKWIVGSRGLLWASGRQANYTMFYLEGDKADVTLHSAADWKLANSGKPNTTRGDIWVNGGSLTLDTSNCDDPTDTDGCTITLNGRIRTTNQAASEAVIVTGCGTVVVNTTGSNAQLSEDDQNTYIASGKTLAVKDTATLQVNAGKKILGAGTVALASGTTLAISNAVDGSVTLPSISAAAGSTVFLASVGSTTPAIVLAGSISGPEIGDYAMLKKVDGPFAAGEYAIFGAAGTAEAVAAAAQKYLEPERADGLTYRYFADGDVVKLEVSALSDLGDYVWVGGAGGNFSVASNWRGNKVPGAGASIYIGNDTAANLTNDIEGFAPASITFLPGSAPVVINGNAIIGVAAVTNNTPVVHEIAAPVHFAGDIQVCQYAMAEMVDLDKAHVTFTGGAYAAEGFALENGDSSAVYSRCIFGKYYLANAAGNPWTAKYQNTNRRVCIADGSSLYIPHASELTELYIGNGAKVDVGEMVNDAGRFSYRNYGEMAVTNLTVTGTGDRYMSYNQGTSVPGVFKFESVTNAMDNNWFYFADKRAVSSHAFYFGEAGVNIVSEKAVCCFGNTGDTNTETIRPWYSDFTITAGDKDAFAVVFMNNVTFDTDDENGVGRTITLDAITRGDTSPKLTVSGSGTLKVNKTAINKVESTVTVTNTATLAFAAGATFGTGGETTVRSGATLALPDAATGTVSLGTLTLDGGAKLALPDFAESAGSAPLAVASLAVVGEGKASVVVTGGARPALGRYPIVASSADLPAGLAADPNAFFSVDATGLEGSEPLDMSIAAEGNTLYLVVSSDMFLWTGEYSGNFNDPANWLAGSVPANGADIYFDNPTGTVAVAVDTAVSLGSVTVLSPTGAVSLVKSGDNTLALGTIHGPGSISIGEGELAVSGGLDIASDATVIVNPGCTVGDGDVTIARGATLVLPIAVAFSESAPTIPGNLTATGDDGKVTLKIGAGGTAVLGGKVKLLTVAGGFGELTLDDFDIVLDTVNEGEANLAIEGDALWVTAGGDFIWTGLGDGVNFSDPLNWENGEIAPTNGARVIIHTAEASTLFCDIADFAPASIEFLSDSAAVTVKASGEGSLTNLVKVLNYADDVHHLFDMPVFFADQVEAEITFSNSRYIKFKNLTAWDLKKSNGSIYFWGPGTYEFLREDVDWSTSSKGGMIYMPNGSKTTLILHNPVMHSSSHNIDVRTNSKLVIRGDYNIYAGNGGERRVVFKAYGNNNNSGVWVDGWIKVGEQTRLRPNSGLSGGRLCAYGIENNSEMPAELSTDTDGFALSWGIGAGGLAGTGTFKTAKKPVWLRPLADYAIARPFEVASTLKFDTTSITNNKVGMTTTVADVISGVGNVEIVGKGAVRFAQNATFTGGLTVSGTATLALDEEALPGAGDVAMSKGTTLVIPHGTGLEDSLVAFPGAYTVSGDAGKVKIRFDGYAPPEGEWVKVFTADSIDINGQQTAQVFDFGFLAASEVRNGNELWLNKGNYGYIWADGASAEGWHVASKWTLAGRAATWIEDSPAVFTNAGDKTTLDANATASELIFQADATVLAAAGSKLTAPVVSVESGATARIEAETAGALEKTGDGALVVASSRTQQTTLTEGTLVMEGTVDGSKLTLGKLDHVPVTFDYGGKTLTTGGARTFANGVDVTLTNGTFLLSRVSDARLTVASDAVVTNAGWTSVGPNPAAFANSYLHVRGGRLENTVNHLVVGDKSAEGSVSEILVSDGGSIRVANDIRMLTGTTTLTVGDGAVDARDTYLCYNGESEEASVVLNAGGELATRTVAYGANATGSATLLFNGGTLKAKTDKADFVANGSGTGLENLQVKIGAGGAVIDTAGFSVGLPGAVAAADEGEYEMPGAAGAAPAFGLSVASSTGSGVLTLGASGQPYTYTGDTAVEGNATLELVGGTSLAGGIAVRDGAVLKLSGSGTTTAGGALALEAGSAIESGSALTVASATLPASGTVKLTLSTLPAAGKSVTVVTRRNGTFSASDAAKFALESADDCTVEVSADGRSIVVSKFGMFSEGDKYGVNDCGELTQFQADWLNSLDNYGPLSERIKTITPEDLDKASLLNLDILAAGSNGGVEITDIASGSDNDGEFILLDVTLSRTGAVAPAEEGGRTPISGTLKIYATATLEDLDTFADCGEKVTIPDAKFAAGDTVQCTYRRTDDTKMFFRAVVVAE